MSVGGGGGGRAASHGAINDIAVDGQDPAALLQDVEKRDGLPGGGQP